MKGREWPFRWPAITCEWGDCGEDDEEALFYYIYRYEEYVSRHYWRYRRLDWIFCTNSLMPSFHWRKCKGEFWQTERPIIIARTGFVLISVLSYRHSFHYLAITTQANAISPECYFHFAGSLTDETCQLNCRYRITRRSASYKCVHGRGSTPKPLTMPTLPRLTNICAKFSTTTLLPVLLQACEQWKVY